MYFWKKPAGRHSLTLSILQALTTIIFSAAAITCNYLQKTLKTKPCGYPSQVLALQPRFLPLSMPLIPAVCPFAPACMWCWEVTVSRECGRLRDADGCRCEEVVLHTEVRLATGCPGVTILPPPRSLSQMNSLVCPRGNLVKSYFGLRCGD